MHGKYGIGLVDLIHPITGEFNHEAVLRHRGGRPEEHISDTKSIGLHHALGKAHAFTQPEHLKV